MVVDEEMESISIYCTMRVTLSLVGQAHWRADRETKAAAAISAEDSMRQVLTARGRTGGVVTLYAIHGENATFITKALGDCLGQGVALLSDLFLPTTPRHG